MVQLNTAVSKMTSIKKKSVKEWQSDKDSTDASMVQSPSDWDQLGYRTLWRQRASSLGVSSQSSLGKHAESLALITGALNLSSTRRTHTHNEM